MKRSRFTKTLAGLLIFALVLVSAPTLVLANPVAPPPTTEPADTPPPPATPPPATTVPAPTSSPPAKTNPSGLPKGSYACAGRNLTSFSRFFRSVLNPISTFFEESLCLAIIVSGLVAGNLACWLIATFIDPIFSPENQGKTCTPDPGLTNATDSGPANSGSGSGGGGRTNTNTNGGSSGGTSSGGSGSSSGDPNAKSPAGNSSEGTGAPIPPGPQATPVE